MLEKTYKKIPSRQGRERISLVVPPCFDQRPVRDGQMILKNAITGNPVEIPVRRCFPDSQATFSAADTEEDSQPMIFPLLRIPAPTPPDPCQYEFVLALVYRVITKLSSHLIPTRIIASNTKTIEMHIQLPLPSSTTYYPPHDDKPIRYSRWRQNNHTSRIRKGILSWKQK